jgi:hypothetical protein
LWALDGLYAFSDSFATMGLAIFLLLLLSAGAFLLIHGIIDAVRDLRRSAHEHQPQPREASEPKADHKKAA